MVRENYAKEKVIGTYSEGCRSYSITFGFLIKHLDTPQKNMMESKNAGLFDSDIFCFPVLNFCVFFYHQSLFILSLKMIHLFYRLESRNNISFQL